MSGMYNVVFGVNPLCESLLEAYRLDPSMCGRLRDFYILKEENKEPVALLVTRNGGGNRSSHEDEIKYIESHPMCMGGHDDSYDNTYALFPFKIPEKAMEHLSVITDQRPDLVVTESFGDRWKSALRSIENGTPSKEAIKGIKAMGPIFDMLFGSSPDDDEIHPSEHLTVIKIGGEGPS